MIYDFRFRILRQSLKVLFWMFASLVAIVLLEHNAILGLIFAGIAGVIFGILLFVK
ncbi:MAG: hypothetical protein HY782_07940 [Chloroflexi bacterium]|nr:hypothetical protein [Chloroflexota bacterium]